jgi:heme/copper-type cytochrome/quinol oxidase subunit 1
VLALDADAPADVRPQPRAEPTEKTKSGFRVGIALVGAFATVAGIGEIIVGLTGNYSGILAHCIPPATWTIIIGAFYSLGGLSILTMRKLGAALGILFSPAKSWGDYTLR